MTVRLERWKLSRTLAVCVVFAAMTIVIAAVALLLVPMLERQIAAFIERLPKYVAWFRETAVPFLVVLYFFYQNVNRLLPAAI